MLHCRLTSVVPLAGPTFLRPLDSCPGTGGRRRSNGPSWDHQRLPNTREKALGGGSPVPQKRRLRAERGPPGARFWCSYSAPRPLTDLRKAGGRQAPQIACAGLPALLIIPRAQGTEWERRDGVPNTHRRAGTGTKSVTSVPPPPKAGSPCWGPQETVCGVLQTLTPLVKFRSSPHVSTEALTESPAGFKIF